MKHLDTFSGIGGWALAARWMGWETVAFVEKEKFCQKVLNKNFPGVPVHDDIFTFSGKPFRGTVDILTGSTPCQPFSQAGKREGSNDERHLFPEFLRVVAEVQPRWIVIENVYGLLSIESGQVFEDYHTSLEGEGYSVQTLCIPASALNAKHKRDRIWIVSYANEYGKSALPVNGRQGCGQLGQIVADTECERHEGRRGRRKEFESAQNGTGENNGHPTAKYSASRHSPSERLPDWAGGEMGQPAAITEFERPGGREIERDFCGISYGVSSRVDRLKSLGNAIVPQIAYEIFRAIEEVEKETVAAGALA